MKIKYIAAIILLFIMAVSPYLKQFLQIGTAYKAKLLCSKVFLAGRQPASVLENDLNGLERIFPISVDMRQQTVRSGWPWLIERTAQYLPSIGCALLIDTNESRFKRNLQHWLPQLISPTLISGDLEFKTAQSNVEKVTALNINKAVSREFSGIGQTRALLIYHQDRLLFERYAPGFTDEQPILGWSMTKSVLNAVIGILVRQGKMHLNQPAPVQQWQSDNDARASITLANLLQMSSGLEFNEVSGTIFSDVTDMLFMQPDCAAFAAEKKLRYPPGSHWYYSSGTSNILSGLVSDTLGGSNARIFNFMRQELFYPLGMYHASIEPDSNGHLIASSFMYATAREWLRFGQLYLNDGVWKGQRILPEGWVKFSRQAAPASKNAEYGAHFWINCGESCTSQKRPFPELPGDMFYASGYKGQRLIIIPSKQLIILRLSWDDEFNDAAMVNLVKSVINTITE